MTSADQPKIFGTGLIALDIVTGPDPETPVRSWAGGTCGNVMSILAWLGWDAYPIARMNGDLASECVHTDMARWGVHLDWATCAPTTDTPIIVQEIRRGRDGRPRHRFSWSCQICGRWLPPFKAITVNVVEKIRPALADASVFFLDRLSRATLTLAAEASALGAVVVFEPSGKATDKLMAEAIALAHIVKYADDRLAGIRGVMANDSAALLEVQTLGERGLKYRHRLGRGISDWMYLQAVPTPRLADTCGSGDWCTAGLIAKTAVGGEKGLRRAGARGVRAALRYGQALAAWNCGFEGARGGMYSVPREAFESQITSLLNGRFDGIIGTPSGSTATQGVVTCPACPPAPRKPRGPGIWSAASPLNFTPSNTYGNLVPSVDDAIEKTQAVIDQVQVAKRGLMQVLLTQDLPGRHTRFKQTEIGEIPKDSNESYGWRSANLGGLAQVNPEQLGSRTGPDYLLEYLDIAAIEQPGVIGASRTLRFSEAPSRARRLAREGDILVSTVRPYLRNFARVREAPDNLVVSTGYAVVRPGDGVDGRFLYQHILSARFAEFLKPRMSGSNYPAVTEKDVEAYSLSLPPLGEQRKIAAILSSVDDTIERTQAVIDQVQVVKHGLMQELLTRGLPGRHTRFKRTEIGEIPKEWKLVSLGDVGCWSSGGTPSKRQPGYWDGSIPWVSPKDMKRTRIDDAIDHVSKAAIGKGTRVTPRGSILVVVRGMILAHTFPVALTLSDVAFNQDMKALVPNEHFDLEFLLYWLESQQKQILGLVDASSHGTKRLPTSKLFAELVPCPQRDEQENIARVLRNHDLYRRSATAAREGMKTIKSGLMSILLTGELRVTPDPETA